MPLSDTMLRRIFESQAASRIRRLRSIRTGGKTMGTGSNIAEMANRIFNDLYPPAETSTPELTTTPPEVVHTSQLWNFEVEEA